MSKHKSKPTMNFFVKLYAPEEYMGGYVIDKLCDSPTNNDAAISAIVMPKRFRVIVYDGDDIYSVGSFEIKNKEMKLCHLVSVREGFGAAEYLISWLKDFSKEKKLSAITLTPLDNTERFYFKYGFVKDAVNSMIFVF